MVVYYVLKYRVDRRLDAEIYAFFDRSRDPARHLMEKYKTLEKPAIKLARYSEAIWLSTVYSSSYSLLCVSNLLYFSSFHS